MSSSISLPFLSIFIIFLLIVLLFIVVYNEGNNYGIAFNMFDEMLESNTIQEVLSIILKDKSFDVVID